MRANIRDIINATGCNEPEAVKIETHINEGFMLDWSECEMSELNKVAVEVHAKLFKTDNARSTANRLCSEFCKKLSIEIGDTNLHEVVNRNRLESDKKICHSHDFCDANMVMEDAFKSLFGKDSGDDDIHLINAAWDEAKLYEFDL